MYFEEYLQFLESQTRSKETLRAYRQDLNRFRGFLERNALSVTEAKPRDIQSYAASLSSAPGRTQLGTAAAASISRRLSVVASFYDWLRVHSDGSVANPVDYVKRPRIRNSEPRFIDDHQLATLIDGISDVRDKAIVSLFLYSGLRLAELSSLDKTSITIRRIQTTDGSLEHYGFGEVIGKGNKRRAFIVGPKALTALAAYLSAQRADDNLAPLFLSAREQRLSDRAIQHIVDRWCRRLNIPHLHVHQFRHSFATRNVNAGMSSAVLQQLMGHASLSTTQRYFQIKTERIAREYFAVMEYVRQCSPV